MTEPSAFRIGLLSVLVIFIVAGSAEGGTRGNPELTDPKGDTVNYITGEPVTEGVEDLDLVSAWFEESPEHFELHLRVARIIGPSAYRTGVTSHQWSAQWENGTGTWEVLIGRDSLGSAWVFLDNPGPANEGINTNNPSFGQDYDTRISLLFDTSNSEIVSRFPRSFSTSGLAGRDVSIPQSTVWSNLRIQTSEGPGGDATGCRPCIPIDLTGPAANFTFGKELKHNPHARIRPLESVIGAEPGVGARARYRGTAFMAIDFETTLRASIQKPGWLVEPETVSMHGTQDSPTDINFTITPPADARPGSTALLTVEGGDMPASVLVVVGEDNRARLADAVLTSPSEGTAVRTSTLYLQESTYSAFAPSKRPIFTANLVQNLPMGGTSKDTEVDFGPTDTILPAGAWRADPRRTLLVLDGTVRLEVFASWDDVSGLRLTALLGNDPLPIDWDGGAPPAGTLKLNSTGPQGASTGAGKLVAEASASALRFTPGERLAVSLFLEKDGGQGSAFVKVFATPFPSLLNVTVRESVHSGIESVVMPQASNAILVTPFDPAAGGPTGLLSAATITEEGVTKQIAASLLPAALNVGTSSQPPASSTQDGSFARPATRGQSRGHDFTVEATATTAIFTLVGPHATSRFQDNNLDLEIYSVSEGEKVFVKASRLYGPEDSVVLSYYALEESGRGSYQAVVVVEQDAATDLAPSMSYRVSLRQEFAATFSDAALSGVAVWDYSSEPRGDYTLRLTLESEARPALVSARTVTLTSLGPTLPPLASFTFSPALPAAGDAVRFLDASNDTDGVVKNWSWDFGDGATSTEQSPTHRYEAAGAHVVTLIVTDDFGAASLSVTSTVTVVEAGVVGGSAGPVPSTGSVAVYKDAYVKRLAHRENYTSAWRSAEIAGLADREYLAASLSGRTAYVNGNSLSLPTLARWAGTTLSVSNLLGVLTAFDRGEVVQTMGDARVVAQVPKVVKVSGRDVDISGLASVPIDRDTLDDGLLTVTTATVRDNVNARRTLSILDGLLHSDVRTLVGAAASDTIQLETTTTLTLPGASWVAIGNAGDPEVVPLNPNSTREFTVAGTNAWLAIFNPDASTVAGAVFSGDAKRVNWTFSSSRLTVRTLYEATGELLAGQYLLVYTTAEDDATRYAGVMEVARMDAEEIGVAALDPMRAAGLGWAGSRATITGAVASGFGADWDALNGYPNSWTLNVDASSSQGGKPLRLILPAAAASSGGLVFLLDGAEIPLSSVSALGDENTLVATFAVDHFSARTVMVRSIVPGLPPIFLWATLALGAVVSAESLALARQALAGGGGAGAAPRLGSGAQSAAVRRALGYTEGETGPASSLETREIKGIIAGDRVRLTSDRLPSSVQTEAVRRALGLDKETMESKERLLERLRAGASMAPHSPPAATKCKNCGGAITFSAGSVTATCATCGAANTRGEHG